MIFAAIILMILQHVTMNVGNHGNDVHNVTVNLEIGTMRNSR